MIQRALTIVVAIPERKTNKRRATFTPFPAISAGRGLLEFRALNIKVQLNQRQ